LRITMSRGRPKTMSRGSTEDDEPGERRKTIGRGWWALANFRPEGKFPAGVEMRRPAPTVG
jgi:hypothetical protein